MWEATSAFSPLEVPQALAAALGNPQDSFRSIHVAGTNGKGSTCAFLAASFIASGHRVGQFVSPHLSKVTERCLLDGEPCEDVEFAAAVDRVLQVAEELALRPSYFVVTMLATFLVFAERQIDMGIIEVGLGGLLDATNILKAPEACVITRIGFDHMHWLGEDLISIAKNKAGIIKSGVPVVVGENEPEVLQYIREYARAANAPCFISGEDFFCDRERGLVRWADIELPLGLSWVEQHSFHAENRATAIYLAYTLGIDPPHLAIAATHVRWPGRTEFFIHQGEQASVQVLFDGLHNPQGARACVEYLREFLKEHVLLTRLTFILSIRSTKQIEDIAVILKEVSRFFSGHIRWVLTGSDIPLAARPEELLPVFAPAEVIAQSVDAWESVARTAREDELVVICGSLYLVGKLRPQIARTEFTAYAK